MSFLDHFLPPLQHVVGEIMVNESSKVLATMGIKLLVDAASRPPSVSQSFRAVNFLAMSSTNEIIRIFHMASEKGGDVDVGDTIHSFACLLSAKSLDLSFMSVEMGTDLSNHILRSVELIFADSKEYHFQVAVAAIYQIINHFLTVCNIPLLQNLLQFMVTFVSKSGKTNTHRNILLMGIIHIFNRSPLLIAQTLSLFQISSEESALQYLIDVWFDLHPQIESPYNLHVSSHGMVELIKIYCDRGASSGFLTRIFRILLTTLAGVVKNELTISSAEVAERERMMIYVIISIIYKYIR